MERFTGTCERLCDIERSALNPLIEWIGAIPFEEWPQNHKMNGQLRPAMITDPGWYGFGQRIAPLVQRLTIQAGAPSSWQHMLSVIMPGQYITPHQDEQDHRWRCRIHVPLITNPNAFLVMDRPFNLAVGCAYKINTEATHFIVNMGETPRVHLMFDVGVGR
jgi:hypothetical protein